MRSSFKELFVTDVPTFVDLQGFIVEKRFLVKEVLRKGVILSHYIFANSMPWKFLTKTDKSCASWLIAYHHELQRKDRMISYSIAKRLITTAIVGTEENNEALVYVKGSQKRE